MKPYGMIKDQTGAVLVIAAIMLLVLSVIGIYAMGSSIIETKISGQKKFYDAAFNDADGGVAYVRVLNPFGSIDSTYSTTSPRHYPDSPIPNSNFDVDVSYLGNSPPPVGSGTGQRAGFRAHHHLIVSTGRDAPQAVSNASATLEMEGYRIGF
jgi:hypothetical protein